MGASHPDQETLSRFAEGELTSEEVRQVDQHLAICSECRDRIKELAQADRLELLEALLFPEYDQAFERAAVRAADHLESLSAESSKADDLLSDLLRDPPALRRQRAFAEERFHSLKLCQLLQTRSREHWFSDPRMALEWAELAVAVAHNLDPGRYGSQMVEDARALSWAYVGNAYRITSDLWRAAQSFRQAWLHHRQAGGDFSTEAELLSLTSSLRIRQGRYEDAAKLSDRAIALYREGRERHLEGASLLQKGAILTLLERFKESIQTIELGLARIDPGDTRLLLVGKHNLVNCYLELGAFFEANRILRENRTLYEKVGWPMALGCLRWVEGKCLAGLGMSSEAKTALVDALQAFMERQGGREFFYASLDLARLLFQEGSLREVRDFLRTIIPLGERLGWNPKELFLARWLYARVTWA
jgi:tetratricopeptide (TPR) repeat protein